MRYDVAVIGGGPAGAWCACRLSSAGARVALIDGSHPREKPCGGGVTARALELVGGACPSSTAVSVASAAFDFDGRRIEMPLELGNARPRLAVFPRREFDAMLVERARAAGVTLIEERAIRFAPADAGWTIVTRGPAGETPIATRWLIGADGANSSVRKRVARAFDREDLSIACGYFVHGVSGTRIDIRFEDAPAGYLWSFPRPDHLAVGICAQADVAGVSSLMPLAERWIREHVTGGTWTRYSWPIPSLREEALERERPAADSWMLIGDAAGLVDPITREGIYFALESADAAAASLAESNATERYTSRLRDTIYSELTIAAKIKARFYRPTFMRLLIRALERSERIRGIMADLVAGEQPYATLRRRLLATMEWRLASELFRGRYFT
jgi:geranylgeranyl reductase family protein